MIMIKRIYEPASKTDGFRVLVDRLWPRGVTKDRAKIDAWLKDIAPSAELRAWFSHDPLKWQEFKKRYFRELSRHNKDLKPLTAYAKRHGVTLLYGAKDKRNNNAVALSEYLKSRR